MYEYRWLSKSNTKWVGREWLKQQIGLEEFERQVVQAIQLELPPIIVQQFATKDVVCQVGEFITLTVNNQQRQAQLGNWVVRFHIECEIQIFTDKQLLESPIPPWVVFILWQIIKYTALAVAAYFAIFAIASIIKSMVTEKHIVRYYKEGELVKEETTTEPSPWGISTIGIVAIIGLVLILFFVFGIPRVRKKKK